MALPLIHRLVLVPGEQQLAPVEGPPARSSMGFTAQCISLGRAHGYVQFVHADDSPRRLHVGGVLGARIKEGVCRRVVDAPARERSHPGAYTWREGPPPPGPAGARG